MVDMSSHRPVLDLQSLNRLNIEDPLVDSGYSDEMPSLTSTDSQTSVDDGLQNTVEETTRIDTPEMSSIRKTACDLADDIVRFTSERNPPSPNSTHAKTLRRTVTEVTTRHQIPFDSIVRKLNMVDQTPEEYRESFIRVADEMFSDGQYNWGRVVTLYAFAAWMAKYCVEKEIFNSMELGQKLIAQEAGNYVANKMADWISQQGGWDEMDRFFAEPEKPESCLWRGVLCTFLGLGALATIINLK